jgi:hypothetical protein
LIRGTLRSAVDTPALLDHTLLGEMEAVKRASHSGQGQAADPGDGDQRPEELHGRNWRGIHVSMIGSAAPRGIPHL